ncbi:TnsD family Tn7-like transposition protein [Buttiauxella noackiae]|uniref:TnsD family Tn7-like transposition protein n=1 Tax=Buttiauxella noackiae TaxID=82992 RepID=UPI0035A68873
MFIMAALPEETLYSRICRTLTVYGMSPASLLTLIFNRPDVSIHPTLNAELNKIAHNTVESGSELWAKQTLLPLFAWALPGYRAELMDLDTSSTKLLRTCQLSSFAERQMMVLKFCPVCVHEDIVKFGVSYWHRQHQIYGVSACHRHPVKLEYHNVPRQTHIRAGFSPPAGSVALSACPADIEFARFTDGIVNNLSEENVKHPEYKTLLTEMGFNSTNGNLRKNVLLPELYTIASRLENIDGVFLPSAGTDYHYWSTLLHDSGAQHPSKHLLLCYCLTVLSACNDKACTKHKKIPENNELLLFIDRLYNEKCSFSEISRLTGKSRCFIKSVIYKRYGWDVKRNKCINQNVINTVLALAKKGFSRAAIGRCTQLSSGSIEMIISVTPGLVAWRKKCKSQSLRRRYKCQILRYLSQNLDVLRRDVKENCMAGFYWLYFHEKSWLEEHLPMKEKPSRVRKVDWQERDKQALLILQKAFLRGYLLRSLSAMDELIGGHGWLIKNKDKFPMTLTWVNSLQKK